MEANNTPPTVPNTFTQSPPEPEPSSNKFVMMLLIGIVVIIVLVGGIYLYSSRQQAANKNKQNAAPAPVVQENLESDLNAIEVENTDTDFTSVDSDLQSL